MGQDFLEILQLKNLTYQYFKNHMGLSPLLIIIIL